MNIFPEALKIKKRSFAFVWLTPVLALFITIWVVYNGFINAGKEIIVQFDSGSNIVEGKTQVKYKGVVVGKVRRFEFTEALDKINVVIQLRRGAEEAAKEGMMFWVVKPRLGLNQITGLETILTGTYIEMRPPTFKIEELRSRKDKDFFIGLSEPPIERFLSDSIFVNLVSKKDPGVTRGMVVYHNGVEAGQILSVKYDEKANFYRIMVAIENRFRKYVNSKTKFWNISRIDMKYDSAGFQLRFDSINAIFQGGIAFDTTDTKDNKDKQFYNLHRNYSETLLSDTVITVRMPETFGVKGGRTPVIYKGIAVGLVTDLKLSFDKKEVLASVQMNKDYEYLIKKNSRFVIGKPTVSASGIQNLSSIVSGVFLSIEAGEGPFSTEFYISEEFPVEIPKGSVEFKIIAGEKGPVKRGSGIYYKGVKTGVVKNVILDDKGVKFCCVIYPEYKSLASTSLYFWKSSSFSLNVEKNGVGFSSKDFSRILGGGISSGFFSEDKGVPMEKGIVKVLHGDKEEARKAFIASRGIKRISLTAEDATGLYKGADFLYKGVKVGELEDFKLDRKSGKIKISAFINRNYSSLLNEKTYFWKLGIASVRIGTDGINIKAPGLKEMVKGGIGLDLAKRDINKGSDYFIHKDGSAALRAVKIASFGKMIKLYYTFATPPDSGAPVYYRGVKTGETGETGYDKKLKKPFINIYVESDFEETLKESTRFFVGSGLEVKADGGGLKAKFEPVLNYVKGSVHYDTFIKPKGTEFLYRDRRDAEKPDCTKAVVKLWSGHNLKRNAPVISKGREIGFVERTRFDDQEIPEAVVMIRDRYKNFLSEGALFWTESVNVSFNGVKNAQSLILGDRMVMAPGSGKPKYKFEASQEPLSELVNAKGLHLVLYADNRNSLEIGSPVYFRQVQTGEVEWVKLAKNGKEVEIGIFIREKYSHLVNRSSSFTSVTGVGATFGFFSGFKLKTESMKSVVKGGVSFETANDNGEKVNNGDRFELKVVR